MKNITPIILASLTLAICGCTSADGPLISKDADTDTNGNAVSTSDQATSMNNNYVSGTGGSATQGGSKVGGATGSQDAGGGQTGSMTNGGGYH